MRVVAGTMILKLFHSVKHTWCWVQFSPLMSRTIQRVFDKVLMQDFTPPMFRVRKWIRYGTSNVIEFKKLKLSCKKIPQEKLFSTKLRVSGSSKVARKLKMEEICLPFIPRRILIVNRFTVTRNFVGPINQSEKLFVLNDELMNLIWNKSQN